MVVNLGALGRLAARLGEVANRRNVHDGRALAARVAAVADSAATGQDDHQYWWAVAVGLSPRRVGSSRASRSARSPGA